MTCCLCNHVGEVHAKKCSYCGFDHFAKVRVQNPHIADKAISFNIFILLTLGFFKLYLPIIVFLYLAARNYGYQFSTQKHLNGITAILCFTSIFDIIWHAFIIALFSEGALYLSVYSNVFRMFIIALTLLAVYILAPSHKIFTQFSGKRKHVFWWIVILFVLQIFINDFIITGCKIFFTFIGV